MKNSLIANYQQNLLESHVDEIELYEGYETPWQGEGIHDNRLVNRVADLLKLTKSEVTDMSLKKIMDRLEAHSHIPWVYNFIQGDKRGASALRPASRFTQDLGIGLDDGEINKNQDRSGFGDSSTGYKPVGKGSRPRKKESDPDLSEGIGALAGSALKHVGKALSSPGARGVAKWAAGSLLSAAGVSLAERIFHATIEQFASPNTSEDKLNKFIDAKLRDLPEEERAKLRDMIKRKWREEAAKKKVESELTESDSDSELDDILNSIIKKKLGALPKGSLKWPRPYVGRKPEPGNTFGFPGFKQDRPKPTLASGLLGGGIGGKPMLPHIPERSAIEKTIVTGKTGNSSGSSLKDIYNQYQKLPEYAQQAKDKILSTKVGTIGKVAGGIVITAAMLAAAYNWYFSKGSVRAGKIMGDAELRADIANNMENYCPIVTVVTRAELDPTFKKHMVDELFANIRKEEKARGIRTIMPKVKVDLKTNLGNVGKAAGRNIVAATSKFMANMVQFAARSLAEWLVRGLNKHIFFSMIPESVIKSISGSVSIGGGSNGSGQRASTPGGVNDLTQLLKGPEGDAVIRQTVKKYIAQKKLDGEVLIMLRKEFVIPSLEKNGEHMVAADDEAVDSLVRQLYEKFKSGQFDSFFEDSLFNKIKNGGILN